MEYTITYQRFASMKQCQKFCLSFSLILTSLIHQMLIINVVFSINFEYPLIWLNIFCHQELLL